MFKNLQFQAIGVLNVKSDLVSFSVVSVKEVREVITVSKHLTLKTYNDGAEDPNQMPIASSSSSPPMERGHVEQDPNSLWNTVVTVINEAIDNMMRLGISITYLKSVGITNEMGTLMAWHSDTGDALYNAIHWTDSRMTLGGGGTAAAIKWLNLQSTVMSCAGDKRRFGTLDTWLLWKLTNGQKYTTDITNASYTRLFNIETMDWNYAECQLVGLDSCTWPTVRCRPGLHGIILNGRLNGLSVHAIMAHPSAALYGHRCYRRGQTVLIQDILTSTAISSFEFNGWVPPTKNSPTAPLPVVGYWAPNDSSPVLGLMAVSFANGIVQWLKDSVSLTTSVEECMNTYAVARPVGSQAYIVPALEGMLTSHRRPNIRFVLSGITENMTREHVISAAVDSMCYTAADIVRCTANGWPTDTVFVNGPYSHYIPMVQRLADVLRTRLVRSRCEMAVDGVARMAASIINIKYKTNHKIDVFEYAEPSTEQHYLAWSMLRGGDDDNSASYARTIIYSYVRCWVQWLNERLGFRYVLFSFFACFRKKHSDIHCCRYESSESTLC